MNARTVATFSAAAIFAGVTPAASAADDSPISLPAFTVPSLSFNLAAAIQPPDKPPAPSAESPKPADAPAAQAKESERPKGYGRAGSSWWTADFGWANDFHANNDLQLSFAWSTFVADELEFGIEAGAWYFAQRGKDTEGLSAQMLFRWHFWHADDFNWTVFGDVGIGILGAFDEVPDGGTSFDFLPRVGAGFTKAFDQSIDGESTGARWMVGLRYHHISNGRIHGDQNNPSRDGIMLYAGIVFPF